MGTPKSNQAGRATPRQMAGYCVLSLALIASGVLCGNGRLLIGWIVGAVAFALALLLSGVDRPTE